MNNEIKETIDYFKKYLNIDDLIRFDKILDYITNLQIIEKDHQKLNGQLREENKRLNKGYCELKEKCNNGECDCQNEEYWYMCESNMKLSLEVDRLNNIIKDNEDTIINKKECIEAQNDTITNLQEENEFLKLNNPEMNIRHFDMIKENKRKIGNLRAENKRLKKTIIIMEKYLELIHDLGYDYDGLNYEHDLKGLIDDMVRFASLGRACNTTQEIYVDGKGKSLNILGEELQGEDNDK